MRNNLLDRVEALEAAAPLPTSAEPIVVRTVDARKGGQGLLPDSQVTGASVGKTHIARAPGESVEALVERAAAGKALTRGARCVVLLMYSVDD